MKFSLTLFESTINFFFHINSTKPFFFSHSLTSHNEAPKTPNPINPNTITFFKIFFSLVPPRYGGAEAEDLNLSFEALRLRHASNRGGGLGEHYLGTLAGRHSNDF